jgi:hypothetical protein
MHQKVRFDNVKKNQKVTLTRELPADRQFGNKRLIKEGSAGNVKSDGFVGGQLKVEFYSHYLGTELTQFNELSAYEFLMTDIY